MGSLYLFIRECGLINSAYRRKKKATQVVQKTNLLLKCLDAICLFHKDELPLGVMSFRDVMPYSLVGRFLCNVGMYLPNYTALLPSRP
jgi:hypothetical protein